MPRKKIKLDVRQTVYLTPQAKQDKAALIQYWRELNPEASIEKIDGKDVLYWCEWSGSPIFDGDKYLVGPEGEAYLVDDCEKELPDPDDMCEGCDCWKTGYTEVPKGTETVLAYLEDDPRG